MKLMLYSLFILACSVVFIKAQWYQGPATGGGGLTPDKFLKSKALQPQIEKLLARPGLTEEDRKSVQEIIDNNDTDNCQTWQCSAMKLKKSKMELGALTKKINMQQAQLQQ